MESCRLEADQSRVDVTRWSRVTEIVVSKLWNQYQKSSFKFQHDIRQRSPKAIKHAVELFVALFFETSVYYCMIIALIILFIYTILWI